jgi:uncharacterized membrane protein YphA (DoxX/SURF4 family)
MTTIQAQTFRTANEAKSLRPTSVPTQSWTLQALAGAMFLFAGTSKLAGVPMMVQMFDVIGVGQWFRYVTGTIEVVGAVLLFVPSLARFGALALAATMVGAIITHLFIVGGNPAVPIVLLAATTITWATTGPMSAHIATRSDRTHELPREPRYIDPAGLFRETHGWISTRRDRGLISAIKPSSGCDLRPCATINGLGSTPQRSHSERCPKPTRLWQQRP